jgi:hypothetical protein
MVALTAIAPIRSSFVYRSRFIVREFLSRFCHRGRVFERFIQPGSFRKQLIARE